MARRLGDNGKESDARGPSGASRSAAAVSAPLYLDVALHWVEALWWTHVVLALRCVKRIFLLKQERI